MASSNEVRLAKPGNKHAAKTLKTYSRVNNTDLGITGLSLYMIGFMWFMMADGTTQIIAGIIWAAVILLAGTVWLTNRKTRITYKRLVANGDIVVVDENLVEIWDQLCADHNVVFDSSERERRICELFYAAQDLKPDLDKYADSVDHEELCEQKLLAEARIRARLMRELTPLIDAQKAQRELDSLIEVETDWATPEEVQEQLDILRKRRTQNDTAEQGHERHRGDNVERESGQ